MHCYIRGDNLYTNSNIHNHTHVPDQKYRTIYDDDDDDDDDGEC